jgi:hypothetical protein
MERPAQEPAPAPPTVMNPPTVIKEYDLLPALDEFLVFQWS